MASIFYSVHENVIYIVESLSAIVGTALIFGDCMHCGFISISLLPPPLRKVIYMTVWWWLYL